MKLSKNFKQLQASSLVESVIAIAIISICVLVAFMVYINVMKQNDSTNYFKAKHQVDLMIAESISKRSYDDENYVFDRYTIDKKVLVYQSEGTALLSFTIKTMDKTYVINNLISYNDD